MCDKQERIKTADLIRLATVVLTSSPVLWRSAEFCPVLALVEKLPSVGQLGSTVKNGIIVILHGTVGSSFKNSSRHNKRRRGEIPVHM